jgi:hypothetical protein
MSADKEVGQGSPLLPSTLSVNAEGLSGKVRSFKRNWFSIEPIRWNSLVQIFNARVAYRDLCIDNGINYEARVFGCLRDCCGGPCEPLLIFGEEIEQDVAVDEYGGHLFAACESHDSVRGHINVATSSQVCDQARAPTILPALLRADKADGLAVELEIYLGVRKKACLLADFNGDGHLTF